MLSWAPDSLLADGRSQGDIRQGVTLEVFGEGESLRAVHRRAQGRDDQAPGRHPLRDHLGLARRVPRDARAAGRLVQRRVVRRGGDRARVRRRVRRPRADARRAGPDARAGRPRHDRGGARGRLGPDLRPRLLRPDRRAGRAVRGRRAARRDVHQPHPQRGGPAPRGGRRADRHRPTGEDPGGDLPPQGGRPVELGQARRGVAADRGGPRLGAADHGRHVPVHRRRHRARRGDAHLGPGRRPRRLDRPAEGPGHPRPGRSARSPSPAATGRASTRPPARPRTSCSSRSRTTSSSR